MYYDFFCPPTPPFIVISPHPFSLIPSLILIYLCRGGSTDRTSVYVNPRCGRGGVYSLEPCSRCVLHHALQLHHCDLRSHGTYQRCYSLHWCNPLCCICHSLPTGLLQGGRRSSDLVSSDWLSTLWPFNLSKASLIKWFLSLYWYEERGPCS